MIGKKAPNINVLAMVQGNEEQFSLEACKADFKVIFFYPKDFTYVCPTELIALQNAHEEFNARNVQVVGCSVDSLEDHKKWLAKPQAEGGIMGFSYPLIADTTYAISRAYGVFDEDVKMAYRGVFVLDKQNVVQAIMINNMSIGRNVNEIVRIIDGLIFMQSHHQMCPANWQAGCEGIPFPPQ